jgi:hypothetical protein
MGLSGWPSPVTLLLVPEGGYAGGAGATAWGFFKLMRQKMKAT